MKFKKKTRIVITLAVYFMVGFIYNLVINRKKGLNAIPHYKFCSKIFIAKKTDVYEQIE